MPDRDTRRTLPLPGLLGLLVVFLLLPQAVSLVIFGAAALEPEYGATRAEVAGELVAGLGAALIAITAIAWLGWGRLVRREPLRTRRWVWLLPIALIGASLLAIDTRNLQQAGATLALTLLLATFATGASEELFFRGIALQAMRDRWREGAAAAGSSLLFGATYLVSAVVLGSVAIHQAILASGLGYVLYLSRRVSGGIAVPILAHWLLGFSLLSDGIGRPDAVVSDSAFALILVQIVLVVAALMATRAVAPRPRATEASAEEPGPGPDSRRH
jgi:membrane protease YdiL (CAAX protease family)